MKKEIKPLAERKKEIEKGCGIIIDGARAIRCGDNLFEAGNLEGLQLCQNCESKFILLKECLEANQNLKKELKEEINVSEDTNNITGKMSNPHAKGYIWLKGWNACMEVMKERIDKIFKKHFGDLI